MEQQQPMVMPEEIASLIDKEGDDKHYCGGDLPDSYIYEAAAANEAFKNGAEFMYRHLSPQMEATRKAMEGIIKWEFATDGRKFDVNQKEVLKTVIAMVKDVLDQYPSRIKDK